MNIDILLISGVFLATLIVIVVYLSWQLSKLKRDTNQEQALIEWLNSMQQSVERTNIAVTTALQQSNKNINDTLSRSTSHINKRLDSAAALAAQTSKEIGRISELGVAMKELQLLLQSPKLRGNIGEEVLADMLAQVFPKQKFHLQYSFKSGNKVDAAVQTSAGILGIDAKFPLENFHKMVKAEKKSDRQQYLRQFKVDVRKHIKAISSKYILPEEGTVDFALMYIPSEAVFYEIARSTELLDYARKNRVYPVSPNTLYIHLQTILLSFEGQKLEAKAKQVMKLLRSLQKDYTKVDDSMQILGKHLGNASNQYSNASQQFISMGQKLRYREMLEEGK